MCTPVRFVYRQFFLIKIYPKQMAYTVEMARRSKDSIIKKSIEKGQI